MTYETCVALDQALEQRLVDRSGGTGTSLVPLRKTVVFDRLVARLDRWCSKTLGSKNALANLHLRTVQRGCWWSNVPPWPLEAVIRAGSGPSHQFCAPSVSDFGEIGPIRCECVFPFSER